MCWDMDLPSEYQMQPACLLCSPLFVPFPTWNPFLGSSYICNSFHVMSELPPFGSEIYTCTHKCLSVCGVHKNMTNRTHFVVGIFWLFFFYCYPWKDEFWADRRNLNSWTVCVFCFVSFFFLNVFVMHFVFLFLYYCFPIFFILSKVCNYSCFFYYRQISFFCKFFSLEGGYILRLQ